MPNWLYNYFVPDYFVETVAGLDWQSFFSKGYRLLLVDVDNTLQIHGLKEIDTAALRELERMQAAGFKVAVISNAKPLRAEALRAAILKAGLDLPVYGYAKKPSPRKLIEACADQKELLTAALMLGDQVFTDVRAGKNAGITSILVKPVSRHEPWYIRLKRVGERFVLRKSAVNNKK